MARQRATQPRYMVSIYDDPAGDGALRFTFVMKGVRPDRAAGLRHEPPPEYIASVRGHGDQTEVNWIERPVQREMQQELEEIARQRITSRYDWLAKLGKLVTTVSKWAEELDWATRTVDKKMEDAEIGNYRAPGLLLQQETVRLLLEPIARIAPGAEGAVDLYLMPSYDDIASLYYYSNRWNLHYVFQETPHVATPLETEGKPLTKLTLRKVLDEMRAHAG